MPTQTPSDDRRLARACRVTILCGLLLLATTRPAAASGYSVANTPTGLEYRVTSPAGFNAAARRLLPGDVLVLPPGPLHSLANPTPAPGTSRH